VLGPNSEPKERTHLKKMRKPAGFVDPAGRPNFLSGRCLSWRVTALRRSLFRNRWRRGQASRPVHRSELGAPPLLQASTQVQIYMSSSHNDFNELSLLMELRLAFGPGTRLWAYRSREDLCYDWLHFKGEEPMRASGNLPSGSTFMRKSRPFTVRARVRFEGASSRS